MCFFLSLVFFFFAVVTHKYTMFSYFTSDSHVEVLPSRCRRVAAALLGSALVKTEKSTCFLGISLIFLVVWYSCRCLVYLARLQRSDPLPQAVRHGFGDHGVEQRVTSLLLLIQLFDDFLQLSVFLLLLKDHKKTGTKESTVTVSPSSYNLFNLCLSCSTEARIKGGTSQGSRAFHPLAHLLRTCSHFHFYALWQIV